MKKLWPLLLLLFPLASNAAGKFVSTTGHDSTTACTYASPCNIVAACAKAVPGDTLYFANGTYNAFPLTNRSGTDSTTSGRIVITSKTYAEKTGDMSNSNVIFTGGQFHRSYLTYSHVKFNGDVDIYENCNETTFCPPDGDTLAIMYPHWRDCVFVGSVNIAGVSWAKMDSCRIDTVTTTPRETNFFILASARVDGQAGGTHTYSNIFAYNTFNLNTGTKEPLCGTDACPLFHIVPGAYDTASEDMVRENLFIGNTINITLNKNDPSYVTQIGNPRAGYFEAAYHCNFYKNTWNLIDNTTSALGLGNRAQFFRVKSFADKNTWDHDIINIQGRAVGFMATASSQGARGFENTWKYCQINWNGENGYGDKAAIEFDWGLRDNTIDHCIIKSSGDGIWIPGVGGSTNKITNNTIYTRSGYKALILDLDRGSSSFWNSTSSLEISDNIFYVKDTTLSNTNTGVRLHVLDGRIFTSNDNCFFYEGSPDRQIEYRKCTSIPCRDQTGFSSIGLTSPWTIATGQDYNSIYGNPLFKNSTYGNFNSKLTYNSSARFGTNGYVGAVPYLNYITLLLNVPGSGGSNPIYNSKYIGADGDSTQSHNYCGCPYLSNMWNSSSIATIPENTIPLSPPVEFQFSFNIGGWWNQNCHNPYPMPAYIDTIGKEISDVIISYNVFAQSTSTSLMDNNLIFSDSVRTIPLTSNFPTDGTNQWFTLPIINHFYGNLDPYWISFGTNSPMLGTLTLNHYLREKIHTGETFGFGLNNIKMEVWGSPTWTTW